MGRVSSIPLKGILWVIFLTVLCIACFPVNPLVLTGIVEVEFHPTLFIVGWVVWTLGMVLVMAPFIMFPRRGGVTKGKSFVHTTRLVDSGIYAAVRHPQYLGGIFSIFITTMLWYPHWLFAVLGITGVFVVYWSARAEDGLLVNQFGNDYIEYMKKVPRMNIILGIVRMLKRRQSRNGLRRYNQIEEHLEEYKDHLREGLLKYTKEAFQMLPKMDRPRILDIGCGSGVSTLELARLSRGEVIGIDIDQPALDKFERTIREARLIDRIRAANCSMFDMDFPDESFDIIWSEGSIYAIGFERGLREWKRFLKPTGFIVVHDEQGNVKEKLEQISNCGYELLGYFELSKETWWVEYFAPLEKWIAESGTRYTDDPKILEELHQAQVELDMFKKNPERNSSVCFVMKKN